VTHTTDARAIGVFDSGLGGLTVARAIKKAFPHENIRYLGDTARVPYGTKSATTVRLYAREDIAFLLTHGVKIVIAACNTVSAAALPDLEQHYDVPLMGVVEKGADAAFDPALHPRLLGPHRRIGVIGTNTTVGSEAYPRAIAARDPQAEVIQKACPLLVPLIEEGWTRHPVTRAVVSEYLEPMRQAGIDTLILGCTHYPLITEALADFFGPDVRIVDSAQAMVLALTHTFAEGSVPPNAQHANGEARYYVTDRYQRFQQLVQAFMGGEDLHVELVAAEDLSAALAQRERGNVR